MPGDRLFSFSIDNVLSFRGVVLMSVVKVFVSGRSGSGKTTAINHIKQLASVRGCEVIYMRDYPILYEMFQEDLRKGGNRFERADYEGFKILDLNAFDEALVILEGQIRKMVQSLEGKNAIIVVEFARSDYKVALCPFNRGFLQDTYFFYVEADVETCIQRIHQRVISFLAEGQPKVHHYVPDEILRSYFNKNDWDYMQNDFKRDYGINKVVVAYRNNTGSLDDLLEKVSKFVEHIFEHEPLFDFEKVSCMDR